MPSAALHHLQHPQLLLDVALMPAPAQSQEPRVAVGRATARNSSGHWGCRSGCLGCSLDAAPTLDTSLSQKPRVMAGRVGRNYGELLGPRPGLALRCSGAGRRRHGAIFTHQAKFTRQVKMKESRRANGIPNFPHQVAGNSRLESTRKASNLNTIIVVFCPMFLYRDNRFFVMFTNKWLSF